MSEEKKSSITKLMEKHNKIIEFIIDSRTEEVEYAKRRMKRALISYNNKLSEALEELEEGLDDLEKDLLYHEIENGENAEWEDKVDEIKMKIEDEYGVEIYHEDDYISITKFKAGLIISLYSDVYDEQAENVEFEYQLDEETEHLISLIEFVAKEL